MKKLMSVLTVLFVFSISAFAQMSNGQGGGGGMMGNGQGGGMMGNSGGGMGFGPGWIFIIIIAILVILGIFYMMKRR